MARKKLSAVRALNATGAPVKARSPEELVEHGLPSEDEMVTWRGPWRYYKAFPVRASAAHETAEAGSILYWKLGEFAVETNHPKAEGGRRFGLLCAHGHRSDPPTDYDALTTWVRLEAQLTDIAMGTLTPERPELPPFSGVGEEGEDE